MKYCECCAKEVPTWGICDHCQDGFKWLDLHPDKPEICSFEVRAYRMLDKAYRGIYHSRRIHKLTNSTRWEINESQDLSTYDFDLLTRLVVGAHDMCIRLSITSSGPRMVRIVLWPREGRDGRLSTRHPTIEQSIANYRMAGTRQNEYAQGQVVVTNG